MSGNILLFYQPGNRRRHVSPDVLVVKGLDPHDRENYLLWEEGRPPHVVIEVTSESTRDEDLYDKFEIYRDQVQVAEYFLFDPRGDYLQPPLQGYRLKARRYERIKPVAGRLPSRELGLHLEDHERHLRFFDPAAGGWIPTLQEAREAAEAERGQAEAERMKPKPNAASRSQVGTGRSRTPASGGEMARSRGGGGAAAAGIGDAAGS